jgi:hypothetical protein
MLSSRSHRIRIRLIAGIALLVVGLSMAGCEFLDNIIDSISGGDSAGGGTPSNNLVIVNAEMHARLSGTLVWKDGPDWTYADIESFGTSLHPSASVMDSSGSFFSASWNGPVPGGDGSVVEDSELTVELSADGSSVKRALLRYKVEGPNRGYYSLVEVKNVPFDHEGAYGERHYMLWNQAAIDAVQDVGSAQWTPPDTFASPSAQLKQPPLANIYPNGVGYTYIDVGIWMAPNSSP